ncbi:hypothetical protein BS50DRAFT_161475 [Corynespora cassiicola Philippines]|uniref:Uncharacterized protein n=1 Tax=Corynespora cassiicola Philippines TaxID=1448308 RepID=A0A2T2N6C6_CORCC|nr:hypothetical protein BS50DRAFT_161475 [Corynespora cassiicola Philippines]
MLHEDVEKRANRNCWQALRLMERFHVLGRCAMRRCVGKSLMASKVEPLALGRQAPPISSPTATERSSRVCRASKVYRSLTEHAVWTRAMPLGLWAAGPLGLWASGRGPELRGEGHSRSDRPALHDEGRTTCTQHAACPETESCCGKVGCTGRPRTGSFRTTRCEGLREARRSLYTISGTNVPRRIGLSSCPVHLVLFAFVSLPPGFPTPKLQASSRPITPWLLGCAWSSLGLAVQLPRC